MKSEFQANNFHEFLNQLNLWSIQRQASIYATKNKNQ